MAGLESEKKSLYCFWSSGSELRQKSLRSEKKSKDGHMDNSDFFIVGNALSNAWLFHGPGPEKGARKSRKQNKTMGIKTNSRISGPKFAGF